jgi:hypothetical protein
LLGEWLQNYAKKMRERNAQKYFASVERNNCLAREKAWRNTKILLDWQSTAILSALDESAEWCTKIIQPSTLLINMCGRWESYNYKPQMEHAVVLGGYGDYGKENPKLGFDYAPLTWQQLCALAYHHFEKHPKINSARKRLRDAGIETHWGSDAYNNAAEFNLYYWLDENNVAAIRQLAKEDWGVKTKSQSDEFDQVFDLYLKQNWASESVRKEWHERKPLASWPLPKF